MPFRRWTSGLLNAVRSCASLPPAVAELRRATESAHGRIAAAQAQARAAAEAQMALLGTVASLSNRTVERVQHLSDVGFRVSSQWGEDGIIDWLVGKIPNLRPSFVEFGVENYTEANTRFLLQRHNWRGLIADGSQEHMAEVRGSDLTWRHDLTVVQRFIDTSNINGLFREHGFDGEIGLLSIDIDGQDYWVWQAIDCVNPQIIICEYNAVFGDLHAITVPADAQFDRTRAHHSNLYWGASIRAFEHLAAQRGFTLIGSNREGSNAFFVRNDLLPAIRERIADLSARPSLFRESRAPDSSLTYVRGTARAKAIEDMPVCDVRSGAVMPLKELGALYSPQWRQIMGA